ISPEVTIKLGTIRGTLKTYDGKQVNEFLSVPYAKPPVGDLRFKKPQPLTEAWKEDVIADKWPNMFDLAASKESLIQSVRNYFKPDDINSSIIEDAIEFYFTGVEGVEAKVAFLSFFGDLEFHCPSIIFARHLSKSNTVFQYVFSYDAPSPFEFPSDHLSPCHGTDLPFFFGTFLSNSSDVEVSNEWIRLITDFVKGKTDMWPPYYVTKSDFVVPFYKDYRGANYTRSTKVGFRNIQCEFWKSALFDKF
ncbi:acetylcholinesterase-like protein, partial [Dinothrombium tinctorium]